MEYKYLLELIKSGLYPEFAEDFHKAVIPFLDEETYGRSVLENSSFIASSKNPNKKIHGKGFVARLSGSTIEFMNMWKIMMFGKRPFVVCDGQLNLKLQPTIPAYLIGDDKEVSAMLLGKTKVTYHLAEKKDYFPGTYRITEMQLAYKNGSEATVNADRLGEELAGAVRDGEVSSIVVTIA